MLLLLSPGVSARRRLLTLGFCVFSSLPPAGASDLLRPVALAPRSGPPAGTLFTELPAETTGVKSENNYSDPRMWGELYHEFEVGAIGTGIAIGDYDDDGRPDVFIVSKTETNRLFRNLGNWKFQDVTDAAGVGDQGAAAAIWKQGAAFVDVNNDGRLDLYVCRFNAPNLLYLNQGNGTFREQAKEAGLAVVDASGMAAFADYDRDGWLDLYLQTNLLNNAKSPTGQRDYLFRNKRDGTFVDVTQRAGMSVSPTQGHSATWFDYNDDGWPDLYVANDFAPADFLYRNNGDGTFVNVIHDVVPHMPYSAMGSDLADVNNDGLMDLVVGEMAPTTHVKTQRTIADARDRGRDPADAAKDAPGYLYNTLYLNSGTGRFLEAARLAGLAATDWTWSLRFEDLDNDGRVDLHLTNGMHREVHNTDVIQRQMGTESSSARVNIMKATPVLREKNLAFRNLGELEFKEVGAEWGLNQVGVSFGAAFGDLDGDGDLDLVYSNFQNGPTVLRNDSPSGNRLVLALRGERSNRFGIGARVSIETQAGVQTRQLTLARGYLSSSEPVVHFGLGDETEVKRLTVHWPSGAVQVIAGLAANHRYTVQEPNLDTPSAASPASRLPPQFEDVSAACGIGAVAEEIPVEEAGNQKSLPTRFNRRGPSLAMADLNGDGREDVVVGGSSKHGTRQFVQGGNGSFRLLSDAGLVSAAPVSDGPIVVLDADGDQISDLLVTRGGNSLPAESPEYQPLLYLGNGDGTLRAVAEAVPELSISAGAAVAADFDRDGRVDVFIGGRLTPGLYPLTARSVLLRNDPTGFKDVTEAIAPGLREPGLVAAALWSDVDNDGWVDLVVALEWGGVRFWKNIGGKSFEDRSEDVGFTQGGTGWWTSLATADFNHDGRPDYAVGNVGLNTPYRANRDYPAVLYYGDFRGNGGLQLIEAHYESGKLYPWRSRRDVGASFPAVLKKYPRNDPYAVATLTEIFGEQMLAAGTRLEATTLQSGLLLSRSEGGYEFTPFPRVAQISIVQGMVAGDFDGDGHADLYVLHNSYAPSPAVGRYDGGLSQLLRGDGRGGFVAVPPRESGLVVPGDAKALAVTDLNLDGWPDFLATRNQASAMAFQNRPVAGRKMLAVSLRGERGNLNAVGARVRVEAEGFPVQTAEVIAGGGYASQSTSMLFFGVPAKEGAKVTAYIRWPNGAESKHDVDGSRGSVVFERRR